MMRHRHLAHHGILGQQWGKRNGPPYPLGASAHSTRERRKGWRKSLDKSDDKTYNKTKSKGLTDGQKTAIKVGAAATVGALAVVGGVYLAKSGKLNELIAMGRHVTGNGKSGSIDEIGKNVSNAVSGKPTETVKRANGFKVLPHKESISEAIAKVNPLRGTDEGANNCTSACIASFFRTFYGYDVVAKSTGRQMVHAPSLLEECFRDVKVLEGTATKFGKSANDASEMIVKRFGQNAAGVCGVKMQNQPGGHIFNWQTQNGVVHFFDGAVGLDDDVIRKLYWGKHIDPNGFLHLARLDNVEPNFDAVKECITIL